MGFFNLFKNKGSLESQNTSTINNELYLTISKYNEYIIRFMRMQTEYNYAPISAYEKPDGELVGFLYVYDDSGVYEISMQEVVNRMEIKFEKELANNKISSYCIFYHSQFANDNNHTLAETYKQLKAITLSYNFKNGQKGKIGITYLDKNDTIKYTGFAQFTSDQNEAILRTQLKTDKIYFEDREVVNAPIVENELGIKIRTTNKADLNTALYGIFGCDSFEDSNGLQQLKEHYEVVLAKGVSVNKTNFNVYQLEFEDVFLKFLSLHDQLFFVLPIVKTDNIFKVETNQIDNWEHIYNLGAVILGKAKDEFFISYFATDYFENKNRYLSETNIDVKISGVALLLERDEVYFTAFLPSPDYTNSACFDFLGVLIDFKETTFLHEDTIKGFILTIELITNPNITNFFTIDIIATQENMRFEELTKGMKISGIVQIQGCIAV